MPETPLAIGVDIGGTSIKIGVVYRSNVIEQTEPIPTQDFDGPEPLIDVVVQHVEELRSRHRGIAGVGVGVPGFVNFEQGIVHNLTNVEGWENYRLKAVLSEKFELPVVVDNDANCMTYAEWKRGSGRGLDHLVAITLGTGVGGGVVANGALLRGARFAAGEVGQMSIDWKGREGRYNNYGALEEYIGNNEIAAIAVQAYKDAGQEKTLEDCTPAKLSVAAHRNDEVAIELWDLIGAKLGSAVMNCCWLLNPQAVIIGGGVAKAGDLLFSPLTAHLYSQLSGPFKEHLMVLPARFGNEAGMIGAAAQSLEAAGVTILP
ncbi:ROK family protein [Haloferula chungangensis]|uniref:ROK family protein n=1 Tax=Haloferula chungangensis TaxID=1048331 RepID=A0ABW2L3P2_9BACT